MFLVNVICLIHYALTHSTISMASVVGAAVAKDPSLLQKEMEVSL